MVSLVCTHMSKCACCLPVKRHNVLFLVWMKSTSSVAFCGLNFICFFRTWGYFDLVFMTVCWLLIMWSQFYGFSALVGWYNGTCDQNIWTCFRRRKRKRKNAEMLPRLESLASLYTYYNIYSVESTCFNCLSIRGENSWICKQRKSWWGGSWWATSSRSTLFAF